MLESGRTELPSADVRRTEGGEGLTKVRSRALEPLELYLETIRYARLILSREIWAARIYFRVVGIQMSFKAMRMDEITKVIRRAGDNILISGAPHH